MVLTGQQKQALRDALVGAFNQETLTIMLSDRLNKRLDTIVTPGSFTFVVFQLVELAERENWVLRLAWEACDALPENAGLKQFVASLPPELQGPPPPPPDPYEVCFLNEARDMAFVNRQILRDNLRRLALDGGPRVVVVDGPADSGKSYSFNLISYLAEVTGAFNLVWIDLSEVAGLGYGPDRLASRIAIQMGVPLPPDELLTKASQDSRWAGELSDYVVGQARATNKMWWIVIDGIVAASLPDPTLHFLNSLAVSAALIEPRLRLVLLDYKRELLPPNVQYRVVDETISPLQGLDLQAFFENVLRAKGVQFDIDAVQPAVQWIVDQLPPPYQGDPLNRLRPLVKQAVQILLG